MRTIACGILALVIAEIRSAISCADFMQIGSAYWSGE